MLFLSPRSRHRLCHSARLEEPALELPPSTLAAQPAELLHHWSHENGRSHFSPRASEPKRSKSKSVSRQAGDTRVRRVAPDERLLARRQLPVGRADLSLRQSAAEGAADAVAREAAGGRALGHDAGSELHLRALEPGHQEVRPGHVLHRRPRSRRPGDRGQRLPRRHLERDLSRTSPRTKPGSRSCSSSSRFPAGFPATSRRRRPDRSTKAASWAIRSATPSAPRSTIPT